MPGNGKVFISHAHEDNARCEPLLRALAAWGVDYWFDTQRLDAGDDLSLRIQRAIADRDIFIRVCTAASQRSYWVRLETGAARGLQAEAHHQGDDSRRMLINLILDAGYVREPFDYATVFIEAATQPEARWQDELHRALGIPEPLTAPSVVPTSPPAAPAVPPDAAPPTTGLSVEPPPMLELVEPPAELRPHEPAPAPDTQPDTASTLPFQAEPNTIPTPIKPSRHPSRPPRALLIALAAFLVVASFAGLAFASGYGPFARGQGDHGPTASVSSTGTATSGATDTPQATATPTPPAGFRWVTDATAADGTAHYEFAAPLNWTEFTPSSNPGYQGGTNYSIRVAGPANDASIVVTRVSKAPGTDEQLLNYMTKGDPNVAATGTPENVSTGDIHWIGVRQDTTPPNGITVSTFTYVCHHSGEGYAILFEVQTAFYDQYNRQAYTPMLNSFQFLS